MIMSINDTSYNFTALTPGTNYTVSVAAVNMAGVREASTVTFYTITAAEAVPSGEFKFFINIDNVCMTSLYGHYLSI